MADISSASPVSAYDLSLPVLDFLAFEDGRILVSVDSGTSDGSRLRGLQIVDGKARASTPPGQCWTLLITSCIHSSSSLRRELGLFLTLSRRGLPSTPRVSRPKAGGVCTLPSLSFQSGPEKTRASNWSRLVTLPEVLVIVLR